MNFSEFNKKLAEGFNHAFLQTAAAYDSYLFLLKFLGFLISIFFIAASIYLIIEAGWIENHVNRVRDTFYNKSSHTKRTSIKSWRRVVGYFSRGDEQSLKLAIIEADNILDEALKSFGHGGQTLADRLKKITRDDLPNIDDLWEAHKLRNKLVHETDFYLNPALAERALDIYEKSFKDLGLID